VGLSVSNILDCEIAFKEEIPLRQGPKNAGCHQILPSAISGCRHEVEPSSAWCLLPIT